MMKIVRYPTVKGKEKYAWNRVAPRRDGGARLVFPYNLIEDMTFGVISPCNSSFLSPVEEVINVIM